MAVMPADLLPGEVHAGGGVWGLVRPVVMAGCPDFVTEWSSAFSGAASAYGTLLKRRAVRKLPLSVKLIVQVGCGLAQALPPPNQPTNRQRRAINAKQGRLPCHNNRVFFSRSPRRVDEVAMWCWVCVRVVWVSGFNAL
jgi:hypothetical protein